ncbi:hypothetical protein [Streptodolium elevatio]|uniref:DUF3558 domain-containing protein n=1 Tax=Streptodolium elevatio TaxID=3157996 RepID=A0ABV3DAZ0_9ACTN
MNRRTFGCVWAAVGMWLLTGCFGADENGRAHGVPSTPGTAPSAPGSSAPATLAERLRVTGCDLLTEDQVRTELGATQISRRPEDGGRTCLFIGPTGETVLSVRIGDVPRALLGGPEQVARLTASPTARTEQVPELADAAVFYSDPGKANGIAFARGRGERVTSVNLTAAGPNAQSGLDTLVALARHANNALR